MSQESKIVAVAAGALGVFGLAIVLGGLFMRGRGPSDLTYRQAAVGGPPDPTVFKNVRGKMISSSANIAKLLVATPQALARGKSLFAANCAVCHGADGKGNTPVAAFMHPAPRNFTSPRGWTRGYTMADIFETLTKGVAGTGMAAFDTLPVADRFALAHYVQSLGKFDHEDVPVAEAAELDAKFHLSKEVRGPNKVAVPVVMKHMAAEYAAPRAVAMPPASDPGLGARLCRRLIADPVRAAAVLSQIAGWRKNLDVFAEAAMAGAPGNGFEPAVATLTRVQWQAFHEELAARTPAAEGPRSADAGPGVR